MKKTRTSFAKGFDILRRKKLLFLSLFVSASNCINVCACVFLSSISLLSPFSFSLCYPLTLSLSLSLFLPFSSALTLTHNISFSPSKARPHIQTSSPLSHSHDSSFMLYYFLCLFQNLGPPLSSGINVIKQTWAFVPGGPFSFLLYSKHVYLRKKSYCYVLGVNFSLWQVLKRV